MKRTKRTGTDIDSPSARSYPPKAEKKSVPIRLVRFIRLPSCRSTPKGLKRGARKRRDRRRSFDNKQ